MFKKVLIATDGSEHSERAVIVGSDIAAKHDADLVLVHVLMRNELSQDLKRMAEVEHIASGLGSEFGGAFANTPPDRLPSYTVVEGADPDMLDRVLTAIGEQILDHAERRASAEGVKRLARRLEDGKVADRILEVAEAERVDLIVCGARGLTRLETVLMGGVTHKLLHHAKVSCVTVR